MTDKPDGKAAGLCHNIVSLGWNMQIRHVLSGPLLLDNTTSSWSAFKFGIFYLIDTKTNWDNENSAVVPVFS